MWNDEIVAEVRRIREEYAAEHNNDIDEIYRDIKAKERASGRPVVSFPPKRPPKMRADDKNVDAA